MNFVSLLFFYLVCKCLVKCCLSLDLSLDDPVTSLCAKRTIHVKSPTHVNYFFSWRSKETMQPLQWWDAKSFCRQRCMELVSIETDAENQFIKYFIEREKVNQVWTSGHLCDFEGCEDREDLQPVHINGWFWTGSNRLLGPTNQRQFNDWADNGELNVPQPDYEYSVLSTVSESCLAILNQDGIAWHDVSCYEFMDFICEDNPELLEQAKKLRPKLRLKM